MGTGCPMLQPKPYRDLFQAALESLFEVGKRVEKYNQGQKGRDRVNRQRVHDAALFSHSFKHSYASRRQRRANAAYQARDAKYTESYKEWNSLFDSVEKTLGSLRPAWGDKDIDGMLAQLHAGKPDNVPEFIDRLQQRLMDQLLNSPRVAVSTDSPDAR